jgi:hypothetical protein
MYVYVCMIHTYKDLLIIKYMQEHFLKVVNS